MRIIDVLNADKCRNLFLEIQEFVEISLSEYNTRLESGGFDCSDKDIFDFIWGTINFSKAEICVLDSPLLQRLRRIHQLGMAELVYCNANNTRFSHTIGVTEVADRMARIINQKLERNQSEYDFIEIVRMAAIFHDVGHMFYSHVSESYFTHDETFPRYREITEAKSYFCEKTSSNAALHEMLSVMIVHSPETMKLLKIISPYMVKSRLTSESCFEQFAEYISCLIIGVPVDKMILPYSSIINSAIDADKLDYLSRDSECTKVPIAVDIARIIQKLDVVNIKGMAYPAVWNGNKSGDEPLKIMAIKNSAKKVFWQLSNARSSMYESVYCHHKILTAESIFRDALRKLFQGIKEQDINFADILQWTDDVFNEYWDLAILRGKVNEDAKEKIGKLFRCIKERNLYKRVAAFSRDSLEGDLSSVKSFFRNVIQNSLSSEYQTFVREMEKEYQNVRKLLGVSSENSQTPVFIFVFAKYDAMASMPIENGNGFCIWSSSLMKQETMEAGKKSKQEQFYLLTDCKDRLHVYLALEKVLLKFGITKLSREASICAKVSFEEMNQKKIRLLEKGFYQDSLILLQDEIFEQLINRAQMENILDKYHSFLGVDSCKIQKDSLIRFLKQFLSLKLTKSELEDLLDGIFRLLDFAYYIDRDSFSRQANDLITRLAFDLPEEQKHIITLGNQFDSGQHLTYYFNDTEIKKKLIFDGSIEVALDNCEKEGILCFFDDGAYSGTQVVSIFQELMGVPVEKRTTSEHHVDELTEEGKAKIKRTKIVLLYLCFNHKSEKYILTELEKLGIENVKIYYNRDLSRKVFMKGESIFRNEGQRALVERCLWEIGEAVLDSAKRTENGKYKEHWDERRVKDAALGYNDAQQMVIFSTNVPTYTISAFWCNGEFSGKEWRGLFQRTNKD